MRFTIAHDVTKVDYKNRAFWQQFDEVEVENPDGWNIRFVSGGIVHTFEYCQSSGRGEYCDEYREEVYIVPLNFSNDARANADIMRKTNYDNKQAVLVRKP